MTIKNNLLHIKQQITNSSRNVTLVAVSKFQESGKIIEAISAGQTIFGENRIQEADSKWPKIKAQHPEIELHLIGSLQTNKAGDAVRLFDIIESLDRPKLADALLKEMRKQQRFIPCLIQINIGKEAQKSGIMPDDVNNFTRYCLDIGLDIKGFMCIPPENKEPDSYFQQMQAIQDQHNFPMLSMGMSGDFQTAIKYGATHVRVGTAIFGKRAT